MNYMRLNAIENLVMFFNIDRKMSTVRLRNIVLFIAVCLGAASAGFGQTPVRSPAQFRSITVITEPKTIVWVDGVRFGRTGVDGKLTIRSVSAGVHTLRLRADGYKELSRTLTAVQKGDIKVPLRKATDRAELAFQDAERLAMVDRDKAIEAYKWAIKLRPNYPEALVALARNLTETGDLEEALDAVSVARKLRPGYAEASAVEGRIFRENGENDKAAASFKRAILEGKGFQPEAITGLGLLYKSKSEAFGGAGNIEQETENYEESIKYLKSALKQLSGAPDAMVIYQLLGLSYERLGRNDEAISLYEEFLELYPDSIEATAVRSFIVQLKKQSNP